MYKITLKKVERPVKVGSLTNEGIAIDYESNDNDYYDDLFFVRGKKNWYERKKLYVVSLILTNQTNNFEHTLSEDDADILIHKYVSENKNEISKTNLEELGIFIA